MFVPNVSGFTTPPADPKTAPVAPRATQRLRARADQAKRQLRTLVACQFLKELLATPKGRAYLLTQAGIAESTDEGALFERVSAHVGDPELLRMVKKHAADEVRHAQLFLFAADRQGVGRPETKKELLVLERLNERLGIFNRPVENDRDVMDCYLVLQVIEERAVEQFSMIEPVMRTVDPKSADILRGIAKDEERHLLYCRAIVRRYAPSEEVRVARLRELRHAEAEAFKAHQQASSAHLLDNGYFPPRAAWVWRQVADLLQRSSELPYTRFFHDVNGPIAHAA